MKFSRILLCLTFLFTMFAGLSTASAQNSDLPWGKSKEPTLITPENQRHDEELDKEEEEVTRTPLPSSEGDRRGSSYNPPRRLEPEPRRRDDREYSRRRYEDDRYEDRRPVRRLGDDERRPRERYMDPRRNEENFTDDEILNAGHKFFGKVSKGLAKVIAYAFKEEGMPNGYILGEEAGGALVAGLRYGEGILVTKHFGRHKVYWQGPSIGYDFGAEGSKTMILVYDMAHPSQMFQRFSGVNGSAYLVGGIGLTFQKKGDVKLARIQSGVGVRLGANVGYLKYTRRPTWNPF